MMFARSVGDDNPIYRDPEYAKGTEVGHIVAPPTFAQASAQFDPEYFLRPRPGQAWFGSGKNPSGIAQQVMDGFRPFRRTPVAAGVWAAGLVGLWFLAWREIIGNWTFAMLVILSAVLVPLIIKAIHADRFVDDELAVHGEHLDQIGLGRPFRASDQATLDSALGIVPPPPMIEAVGVHRGPA